MHLAYMYMFKSNTNTHTVCSELIELNHNYVSNVNSQDYVLPERSKQYTSYTVTLFFLACVTKIPTSIKREVAAQRVVS